MEEINIGATEIFVFLMGSWVGYSLYRRRKAKREGKKPKFFGIVED